MMQSSGSVCLQATESTLLSLSILTAIFQADLGHPVAECLLEVIGAQGDGGGEW